MMPRILMYHLVGGEDLSTNQFVWQLEFLRKHFEPVALGDLVERLRAGTTTGREIAITFDDGVRNHFKVAWPLLREHSIPATYFVCSDLIGSDEWMWRSDLRQRLRLLSGAERAQVTRDAGCKLNGIEQIMEWTKTLPIAERRTFQNDVAVRTRLFSPSREEAELHSPLTWDQLRQMDERLITIGSHTGTHPILTTLPDAQLREEIAGSKRALEQNLGRSVDLFCYPNGASNPAVVKLVREHYRAAVNTREDFVRPETDPFQLPRISCEGSRAHFVRRLHRPTS